MAAPIRDDRGRFSKSYKQPKRSKKSNLSLDHNYSLGQTVCDIGNNLRTDKHFNEKWKEGRRCVEFGVLLENLRFCKACGLGPVALSVNSIVGERKKGLSGYLFVRCENVYCEFVNCVPYGKTHHVKKRGMPCFAANTKLGTGKQELYSKNVFVYFNFI